MFFKFLVGVLIKNGDIIWEECAFNLTGTVSLMTILKGIWLQRICVERHLFDLEEENVLLQNKSEIVVWKRNFK